MIHAFQKLFNKDLKNLRSFQQRAHKIATGSVIPIAPSLRTNLANADEFDSALAHVVCQVKKVTNMTPYECQLVGVMGLVGGHISQMQTGEGKTLVAAMAAVLMAASGRSVHLMTVNDYLVERDAEFTRPLAATYGIEVGALTNDMPYDYKRTIYRQSKILYGTPSTFAFDYLRDGMIFDLNDRIQSGPLDVAIIDEVDAILIDEARVPMILSGEREVSTDLLNYLLTLLSNLSVETCRKDELPTVGSEVAYLKDDNSVLLTEKGYRTLEELLVKDDLIKAPGDLYRSNELALLPQIENCLKALYVFREGKEYIVEGGKVVIINSATGRLERDRRWGDGQHQAIEAKEGVEVKPSTYTQSKITMQAFSRLYDHVCGMTGTAITDAAEFKATFNLSVLEVPPHRPNQKLRLDDQLYMTKAAKNKAILTDVQDCQERGQPVLVGVSTLEEGEALSRELEQAGISHNLLTARSHEREAEIIANAGRPGAVTVATNMAGRGTDILLGGQKPESPDEHRNWEGHRNKVIDAGGLKVLGTARHDSRRIDLQLEGRAGRQGDPGVTVFYLSLEDRLFDQINTGPLQLMFNLMGTGESESMSDPRVNRAIEKAQGVIQGKYRDQRIGLERTDQVDENQRLVMRNVRQHWLEAETPMAEFLPLIKGWVSETVTRFGFDRLDGIQEDQEGLQEYLLSTLGVQFRFEELMRDFPDTAGDKMRQVLEGFFVDQILYERGDDQSRHAMLAAIDAEWASQIELLPELYRGVQWRSMAQQKPEQEYAREAFDSFHVMMKNITERSVSILVHNFIDQYQQSDSAAA